MKGRREGGAGPPRNAERRPGQGGAALHRRGSEPEHSFSGAQVKRLTPLELATIFAPAGCVAALIVHSGQLILDSCPADVAVALPVSGSA
jgi:hypothetical protein